MFDLSIGERTSLSDALHFAFLQNGGLLVQESFGRYTNSVMQKRLYKAGTVGVGLTLAATHAISSALPVAGAATPIMGIYNPIDSGIVVSILQTKLSTISGTPAGAFCWGMLTNNNAQKLALPSNQSGVTYGTAGYFKAIGESSSHQQSNAWIVYNTALAASGTAGNIGTVLELETIGGLSAVAVGAGINSTVEDTAGLVHIFPGQFKGIFAYGAGTNHIVKPSLVFEEVPIWMYPTR